MSQPASRGGVILDPTPRDTKHRKYIVTDFNLDELTHLTRLSQQCEAFIIGREKCPTTGRVHYQCYFRFKNQKRWSTMKAALPKASIRAAHGNDQQNYAYCSKEEIVSTNIQPKVTREDMKNEVLALYENVTWKPWQQSILDILACEPDTRKIYWIYEKSGNVGKSFLAKYLACQPGTIVCTGKAGDIFNQVNTAVERGVKPRVVVCDIPRVVQKYVSYQSLECLKNGCLYSGKYEGGLCVFTAPHVICFANERPIMESMSLDRWVVQRVQNDELFLQVAANGGPRMID